MAKVIRCDERLANSRAIPHRDVEWLSVTRYKPDPRQRLGVPEASMLLRKGSSVRQQGLGAAPGHSQPTGFGAISGAPGL
jgi:hypothetical protein